MIETPDARRRERSDMEFLFSLHHTFNIVWGTVFGND
jgi:hypothetical protein